MKVSEKCRETKSILSFSEKILLKMKLFRRLSAPIKKFFNNCMYKLVIEKIEAPSLIEAPWRRIETIEAPGFILK